MQRSILMAVVDALFAPLPNILLAQEERILDTLANASTSRKGVKSQVQPSRSRPCPKGEARSMTAQTRTIAIVAAIILIAFGIYLSVPHYVVDLIIRLSEQLEELTRQVEMPEGI